MSARMSLLWITLTVVLLACAGCGKGGASPTGDGAPPVTATPSATADTTPATAVATGTGQAQSGGGSGSGNSGGGGSGSGNSGGGGSGSGNSGGGGSGSGNSGGGGGAQGAPLHIPSIIIHQGEDLEPEYNAVVASVMDQCGGTMCVSVTKKGTGVICDYAITMNGKPLTGGATDAQGDFTVPRGASIEIDGNADGSSGKPGCPSDDSSSSGGGGSPGDQPSSP
jgi:hypothetical protein